MKKLLATLLVSTMALSAIGGLVACGGDDDGPGAKTDYYMIGSSNGSLFSDTAIDGWAPLGSDNGPESRSEIADKLFFRETGTADVYTITVELYKGDTWCIMDAKVGEAVVAGDATDVWANQIKYSMGDMVYGTQSEYIVQGKSENGGQCNFLVAKTGKYKITLELHGGEMSMPLVKYERVGEATKLTVEEKDVYIKGNVASLNSWDHGFGADWKLDYNATTGTYTYNNLVVVAEDGAAGEEKEFGIEVCEKGATSGYGVFCDLGALGDSGDANDKFGTGTGNFKALTPGTYKIVVSFDGGWTVDFYNAAA